jgi:sugar phosphate isomerase/epimerase
VTGVQTCALPISFFPPCADIKVFLNFGSSDPVLLKKYVNYSKGALEFCRRVDAVLYSVHAGYDSEVGLDADRLSDEVISDAKVFENTKNSLLELCDYAAKYGLRVAVENHSSQDRRMFFSDPKDLLGLLSAVKAKNFGLLVDVGHLNIASKKFGFDFRKSLELVKDKVFEFHVHYNQGDHDEHRPLPDNSFVDLIPKDLGKNVIFTLEGKDWSKDEILRSKSVLEGLGF